MPALIPGSGLKFDNHSQFEPENEFENHSQFCRKIRTKNKPIFAPDNIYTCISNIYIHIRLYNTKLHKNIYIYPEIEKNKK